MQKSRLTDTQSAHYYTTMGNYLIIAKIGSKICSDKNSLLCSVCGSTFKHYK